MYGVEAFLAKCSTNTFRRVNSLYTPTKRKAHLSLLNLPSLQDGNRAIKYLLPLSGLIRLIVKVDSVCVYPSGFESESRTIKFTAEEKEVLGFKQR